MNFEQYVLVGSTVRSYLAWLKDKKKVGVDFKKICCLKEDMNRRKITEMNQTLRVAVE